jgi:hypothetical protein
MAAAAGAHMISIEDRIKELEKEVRQEYNADFEQ